MEKPDKFLAKQPQQIQTYAMDFSLIYKKGIKMKKWLE